MQEPGSLSLVGRQKPRSLVPRIFDNIGEHLLPALQNTLATSERADFCIGYFNLRGWHALAEQVERFAGGEGAQCRLLVGMHRSASEELRDALRFDRDGTRMDNGTAARLKRMLALEFREQLTVGAPRDEDERALQQLADQIRAGKVRVKLFLRQSLHAKLYLCFPNTYTTPSVGFVGSSNLTFTGLQGGGELNVDVLDHDACQKLSDWFEDRWQDRWCIDISDNLVAVIEESWARSTAIPPYHIYLKIARHLADDAVKGLTEFNLPKDLKGVLFDYQEAAVKLAARHLHARGGVVIGDVVGLGKTLMAYANQVSVVNGRKKSADLNLYKLFLERCFRLLDAAGHCGIVIPSGIYTDLGTKGLRQMLFDETEVTALFGFENRKLVFEEVDSRFKFVILTFEKAGTTERFPATFMRHDPAELARFPDEGAVTVEVEAVKRLAAESWGLMEFALPLDAHIAEKMAAFPALGDDVDGAWQIGLTAEFHMTNHSGLFETAPAIPDRLRADQETNHESKLPLWEGKMIHQFDADFAAPRYWVDEKAGREALTKRGMEDTGQPYDYQAYRLGFRDISRSTDTRTFITAILPPPRFHGNKIPTVKVFDEEGERLISDATQLYLCAVWNSFTLDWLLRKQVTTTINFFFVYQLPVPRLVEGHPAFDWLAELAARLVCTTPAFDALAAALGLGDHAAGATDPEERAALRAEIDGRVAHLYGLTEAEFTHVLFHEGITGFHRVPDGVREDALAAYRALAPHPDTALVARQIEDGESALVEFKETFAVDAATGDKHKGVLHSALKTVCGFLNAGGGTLLVGVADDGTVQGLAKDYAACQASNQNADGLENKIVNTLRARLDPPPSFGHVAVTFHEVEGEEVCRVLVTPSDRATRLDGAFFIRLGNTTPALTDAEAERWLANRARRLSV